MQDPNDPGTLCLIEACKRPLSNADRQRRRRERLARERAAGLRIPLGDVSAAEVQLLKMALTSLQVEARTRSGLIESLLQRLEAAEARAATNKGKEPVCQSSKATSVTTK